MTSIKATCDGYSFHTPELKIYPDGKSFNKTLKLLYEAAKRSTDRHLTTYPLKKYESKTIKPHCSTMLRHHGKLAAKEKLDSTSEQLYWMAQHSRELILKRACQVFSSGTHYKPEAAKALIDQSDFHKDTQKQLWWLFKRMRYPFSLEQLEKGMEKQFELKPRTVIKRLDQLQELGINLIPLRKDFYLEQLPSLPEILELLEDGSSSFKLTSNGEIEW